MACLRGVMSVQMSETQTKIAPEKQNTQGNLNHLIDTADAVPASSQVSLIETNLQLQAMLSEAEMQLADLEKFVESGFPQE